MITLSSDFGRPYPAAMKGVVLQRSDATLVDVSHDFPRHDVRTAAFWLREVLPYFPPAVHLVVVDPGVGTDRRALVVRAGDHALVGPDNGVLVPPARRLAAGGEIDAFVVDERASPTPLLDGGAGSSRTFHGRDVFAPAAASVHERGLDRIDDLEWLAPATDLVECALPEPSIEGDRIVAEVLVVDDFGNLITNVPGELVDRLDAVRIEHGSETSRVPVGETFDVVSVGDPVVTVGSHGYVELDVNRGRGDETFGLEPGDRVVLSRR